MDILAKRFLYSHRYQDSVSMLKLSIEKKLYYIGLTLGEFFIKSFPNNIEIMENYGDCLYHLNRLEDSINVFQQILDLKNLNEHISSNIIRKLGKCYNETICDRYIGYNTEIINNISNRPKKSFQLITFTITTCKRIDLFEKTVNSFINCCLDLHLIDRWICIDDNSTQPDREKMALLYPFFEFIFKEEQTKGHPQSMNIIKKMVKTPYIFHMEDDWKFFIKRSYISDCLEVVQKDDRIGQCLINRNYGETMDCLSIKGGYFNNTTSGLRFYIHEHYKEDSINEFYKKHGFCRQNAYWSHYSLRPSLLKTDVLKEVGEFNETLSCFQGQVFEKEYSLRYNNKGYLSAFLESVYCIHIGKLTSERDKPNAYELNNQIKIKTVVINLDKRTDRWENFKTNNDGLSFIKYERFSAIDGENLKNSAQLQRIFDGNDYNMRIGIVGCALSHIKLYIDLVNTTEDISSCILEDDITIVPDFEKKFVYLFNLLDKMDWDIVYLGHHLHKDYKTEDAYDKKKFPIVEKWNTATSIKMSMGGTGGYIINKKGAQKMLEFINKYGMTNAIDTMHQKSADTLNVFYCYPHLIYSECYTPESNIDTDIQCNYKSLTLSMSDIIEDEKNFYGEMVDLLSYEKALEYTTNKSSINIAYYKDTKEIIDELVDKCIHPYYTVCNTVIIIVPNPKEVRRYFNRLKKYSHIDKRESFNIDDAIVYK